jgi:hypothetical protein
MKAAIEAMTNKALTQYKVLTFSAYYKLQVKWKLLLCRPWTSNVVLLNTVGMLKWSDEGNTVLETS